MKPTIRLVVIGDHTLCRTGLMSVIAEEPHFEVLGTADDGIEGLDMVLRTKPDLVLADVTAAGMDGIELTSRIRATVPRVKVMLLARRCDIEQVSQAIRYGATGFLLKDTSPGTLLDGINQAAEGKYFLDNSISRHLPTDPVIRAGDEELINKMFRALTDREQQIMPLLAEGRTVKEIADNLYISPKTVENHRSNIMNKLGIRRRVDLIRIAARLDLIDLDSWKYQPISFH